MITRPDGLTDAEGIVSDHLVAAFSGLADLEKQHPNEWDEFAFGVHICQGVLTTRIARRAFPAGWPVKL